ncbi:dsDNA nuclease domain-containing protein [Escherichia coli]
MYFEKQKEKEKYLFLFEYHDDILVLNSSVSPTSAEFIQVENKKRW